MAVPRLTQIANGRLWDHRTNSAIAATWGFTKSGTSNDLQAIDTEGNWWLVDPLSGNPSPQRSFPIAIGITGIRGMAYAGPAPVQAPADQNFGVNEGKWGLMSGGPTVRILTTWPYKPNSATQWGHSIPDGGAVLSDDYWIYDKGGDAKFDGNPNVAASWRTAWWGTLYPNLVQNFTYTEPWSQSNALLTSSTGTGNGTAPAAPTDVGKPFPAASIWLRTPARQAQVMDLQAVKIGKVIPNEGLHPVISTGGGRVIVLDNAGLIRAQSDDLGYGGMALAVANLDGGDDEEIVFAAAYAPIDAGAPSGSRGTHVRSFVHVLKYQGGASPKLVTISSVPLGDPFSTTHDLHGYAAAGIAIADLNQTGQQNPTPEIIVTTLHGELVVFGQTNGVIGAPLYQGIVDSALGAFKFNSIVVGDLDQVFFGNKPEIYIGSTTGIRKFYVQ